jgi:hypothetical protein
MRCCVLLYGMIVPVCTYVVHAAIGNRPILTWLPERDKAKLFAFAISGRLCYKKQLAGPLMLESDAAHMGAKKIAGGEIMADPRQRRFRLWPWRQQTATATATTTPPSTAELAEKLIELVHFERGVAALYYYLPDESLTTLAQNLCQSHRAGNILVPGIDRDLGSKDATLNAWRAVNAIWHSDIWQPGDILATFGFRLIEAWHADSELWSVVIDPQAQFFGLAVATNETRRYWMTLVTGQKGQQIGGSTATAAR